MELYVENDEQLISDDRYTTQGVEGEIELHQATFFEFWFKVKFHSYWWLTHNIDFHDFHHDFISFKFYDFQRLDFSV